MTTVGMHFVQCTFPHTHTHTHRSLSVSYILYRTLNPALAGGIHNAASWSTDSSNDNQHTSEGSTVTIQALIYIVLREKT